MKCFTLAVLLASIIYCVQVNGRLKQTSNGDNYRLRHKLSHDQIRRSLKFGLTLQCGVCVAKCFPKIQEKYTSVIYQARSCLDHMRNGETTNGYYTIHDSRNQSFPVYCDMTSEPRSAWTLVMSWSLKNRNTPQLKSKPFTNDAPVNQNSPNWQSYRLSHARMRSIKHQSTHWRSTCSFPTHSVDYTDYVRGNFHDFNVMNYLGSGKCKKVEFVNIRGHVGVSLTARFWQVKGHYGIHIDSSHSGCQFVPTSGAASSEDNFGYYGSTNPKFRCTASAQSTTQWWFGGYL